MTLARWGLIAAACGLLAPQAQAQAQAGGVTADAKADAIGRMQAWTHLQPKAIVAVTPELVAGVTQRGVAAKKGQRIDGVEIQGEVLDDGLIQARGWRSMRLKLDLNCASGEAWVREMVVFPEHNRQGVGRINPVRQGWAHSTPEAVLGQVQAALCGPQSAGLAQAGVTADLKPALGAEPIAAPTAPTDAGASPAAQPVAPPAPTLAPAPKPRAPALSAARPAPAIAPHPAGGAGARVQIAAAASAAEAQHALGGAAERLMRAQAGLGFQVEPAQSAGHPVYRALVTGFADRAAAQAWCLELRQAGGNCFVK